MSDHAQISVHIKCNILLNDRKSNYKPNILKFSYTCRWEGISKIKLLKTLEEQNIMVEIIHFENYKFQENDTGIGLAENQFSKISAFL